MVTTRPATAGDKELLRRIHHAAYHDVVTRQFGPWDEAVQDAWFDKNFAVGHERIIELDGVPIGSMASIEADDHIFLSGIQLLPEHQNRGMGSDLVGREMRIAKSLGKPLRLQVLRANRARALYERLGFRLVGETEHHLVLVSGG